MLAQPQETAVKSASDNESFPEGHSKLLHHSILSIISQATVGDLQDQIRSVAEDAALADREDFTVALQPILEEGVIPKKDGKVRGTERGISHENRTENLALPYRWNGEVRRIS